MAIDERVGRIVAEMKSADWRKDRRFGSAAGDDRPPRASDQFTTGKRRRGRKQKSSETFVKPDRVAKARPTPRAAS